MGFNVLGELHGSFTVKAESLHSKLIGILGVYYYRMVQERCRDRFDRNFDNGVYSEICVDLVQMGIVQFKNTRSQAYGKICGDGK